LGPGTRPALRLMRRAMLPMLKPLHDNVVVRPREEEEKTAGGIVLPDAAKEKPGRGKVLEVGPGRLLKDGKRAPMAVKKGQQVLFSKYGGTEVKIGEKRFLIISEEDMYAVEEGETEAKKKPAANRRKAGGRRR